jgi:hypothetical protein
VKTLLLLALALIAVVMVLGFAATVLIHPGLGLLAVPVYGLAGYAIADTVAAVCTADPN